MKKPAKILTIVVAGHFVRDEIVTPSGKVKHDIGGTAYNISALSKVIGRGKIFPVCRIGHDIRTAVDKILGNLHGVDKSRIEYSRFPNVVHRLTYLDDGQRTEWNSGRQTPLHLSDKCLDTDAILVNFISGSDVKLEELKSIKNTYKGLIYGDFHSLSLGFSRDKMRYIRQHPRWRDYIAIFDIVQMNLTELFSLIDDCPTSINEIGKSCRLLHSCGPEIVIITLGRRGVIVSQKTPKKTWHIPALKIAREVDPTGCGDTFAGIFLFKYLHTGKLLDSARKANCFAGIKASFSGLKGFEKIEAEVNKIKKAPPALPLQI